MADLVTEIFSQTTDWRVRFAMIMGALLEGGNLTGPWSVGDNGTSFGPYQIHLPAYNNPPTVAQANDPAFAVKFMLQRYENGVNSVPFALWLTNPVQAASDAVYKAESPAQMYQQDRINSSAPVAAAALANANGQTVQQAAGSADILGVIVNWVLMHFPQTSDIRVGTGPAGGGVSVNPNGGTGPVSAGPFANFSGWLAQQLGIPSPQIIVQAMIELLAIVIGASLVIIGAQALASGKGTVQVIAGNIGSGVSHGKELVTNSAKLAATDAAV